MTTNRPCRDAALPLQASATPAEQHAQEAFEQGARYAAALAIARWSGHAHPPLPSRADWLTQAHEGLGQWFTAGGFAQHAPAPAPALASGDANSDASLPFPGSRPRFYVQFRHCRSTAD